MLTTTHHNTDFVTKHEHLPRTKTVTLVLPKERKMDMGFGTWNVRSQCRAGSLTVAAGELSRYKMGLMGRRELGGTQRAQ